MILFTALSYAQDIELNGTISAQSNQIKNVADPTENQDAATKMYVDGVVITIQQASNITTNTAKVGITTQQASDITSNNAKTGITTDQASAIVVNTAKVGYTEALVSANTDVTANTLKVGITSDQSDAIVVNTAKVGYTQPTYALNTFYAELGGYVITVRDGGKHGLVVAMQDQGTGSWYAAKDLLSDANNHDVNGAKFMDWRLPTKRELNLMFVVYGGDNGASLDTNLYWSSTEDSGINAWGQDIINDQFPFSKDYTVYVRAVRAF